MATVSPFPLTSLPFEVEFDRAGDAVVMAGERPVLHLPVPWLGGDASERLFEDTQWAADEQELALQTAGALTIGCAVQPLHGSLKDAALTLYRRVIAATAGQSLYRVWNYVPEINRVVAGAENYHQFCEGRAEAFEEALGHGFKRALPSASAVGCGGDVLALVFVASPAAPRHLENPEQVPAYDYPREHGPRSPSFSRATVAEVDGRRLVFVSGTAAIKGHVTVAPGQLVRQLDCTLDNLRLVSRAAGLGDRLGAGRGCQRHFKIYLRQASDYERVRERLERDLVEAGDRVVYLRAEICRAALEVEIEATVLGRS